MSELFGEVVELPTVWPNFALCSMLSVEAGYNARLTEICEETRRKDPEGQKVSNRGFGWQGLFNGNTDIFQPLYRAAAGIVNQYAEKLGKQVHAWQFEAPWFNVCGFKDANQMHTHGGDLSIVYYVQVPEGSGQIVFNHPLSFLGYQESYVGELHDLLVRVTPREGLLIVFSAGTPHWVDPSHVKDVERISISFNGNRVKKTVRSSGIESY